MKRENKVYIVGTLDSIPADKLRTGVKDGNNWIGGSAIVKNSFGDLEVKFYSMEKTKDGKTNPRYANYQALEKLVGERIKVSGELSGRVFFNDKQGQLIQFNEINAAFFNLAKASDTDTATFEYLGFVNKPLHERLNKEDKVVGYEIEVAQANYNGDNMQIFKFNVAMDDSRIRSQIQEHYTKGATVFVSGEINFETTLETKEVEVDFGNPVEKTFENVRKLFLIKGGKRPIVEDGQFYTEEEISNLTSSYQNYILEVEKAAKNKSTAVKSEPVKTSNIDRLV